jgi:hypothetical protein
MENSKYTTSKIEPSTNSKIEQKFDAPSFFIIRHGETKRKQNEAGFHKASLLNTSSAGFKLDSEHLDLDDEGIANIETSANQVADLLDKENEVVLIVSSPAWRTQSSALVLEKVLREKGVNVLNEHQQLKFFEAINQHSSFFEKTIIKNYGDSSTTRQVIDDYIKKGYKEGFKSAENTFGTDFLKKMEEEENLNFQRFLRHMNNIYHWLKDPKILQKLNGKKLRIVVLAHEETTKGFIKETMPEGTLSQENGQILEIIPESELVAGGDNVVTNVKLYPKKKSNGQQSQVKRGFKID